MIPNRKPFPATISRHVRIACACVALGIAAAACSSREAATTEHGVDSVAAAIDAGRADAMQRTQERLDRVRAEIDSLDHRIATAGSSLKSKMGGQLVALKAERDSADLALTRMRGAASNAWEGAKAGADRALEKLEQGVGEARARIHSRADSASTR